MRTFRAEQKSCPTCSGHLLVYKTQRKNVVTITQGTFMAKEVQTYCPRHKGEKYRSKALTEIVPRGCSIGFEVIAFVGLNRWLHHKQIKEIKRLLGSLGVEISIGELSYLSDKFLLYLQEAHRAAAVTKELISSQGGYVLHVDGTQENGSSVLLTAREGLSGITLASRIIQTESKDSIAPLLEEVKRGYGEPTAVMRDMGSGMKEAVTEVFPGVLQLVCHFHFLRDLGKDLLIDMHKRLKKAFTDRKITPRLRGLQRRLYPEAEQTRVMGGVEWTPRLLVYVCIGWILAYSKGDGYGIPFSLPYKEYYERCKKAHEWVIAYVRLAAAEYKIYPELLELKKVLDAVTSTGDGREIPGLYRELDRVWGWFSELRRILRLKNGKTPLSGEKKTSDEELDAITAEMERFMKVLRKKIPTSGKETRERIRMILHALDDHWDELFAPNPKSPDGNSIPLPRTNNLMERGYRGIKRGVRRRTGKARTDRDVVLFGPGLELVSNLEIPHYREHALESSELDVEAICRVFAEVDQKQLDSAKSELKRRRRGMEVFNLRDEKKLQVLAEGLRGKAAELGMEPPTLSWLE